MSKKYAILADDMRLGKTVQAIAAIEEMNLMRCLVICPASVISVWRAHLSDWAPNRGIAVCGYGTAAAKASVLLASYAYAANHADVLMERRYTCLILDEAHYLANPRARRTKAIIGAGGIASMADRVWALSGTIMRNHPGDLWALFYIFSYTTLSYGAFLARYCLVDSEGRPFGHRQDTEAELRRMIDASVLRRVRSEVAVQLPKAILQTLTIEPDPEYLNTRYQRTPLVLDNLAEYRIIDKTFSAEFDPLTYRDRYECLANPDRHMALWRRVTALLKIGEISRQIVFEINYGLADKLVVFAYHLDAIKLLASVLGRAGIGCLTLTGSTPALSRGRVIEAFNDMDGPSVLICNIIAAGTGIDLSAACEAIILEEDWVPANNAQAIDRLGGFRQTRQVRIRKYVLENSIDQVIGRVLERKMRTLSVMLR